jgi:hypothetical protein
MFKYFLIVFLLFSVQLPAQEEIPPSPSEKMADSILKRFNNTDTGDIDMTSEEDREKLIAAEEKYMNEFLQLERDREETKKFKLYLQALVGFVFLAGTIIVLRNNRKRRVGGR